MDEARTYSQQTTPPDKVVVVNLALVMKRMEGVICVVFYSWSDSKRSIPTFLLRFLSLCRLHCLLFPTVNHRGHSGLAISGGILLVQSEVKSRFKAETDVC